MFSGPSFIEEGVERIISGANGLVRWHFTVRMDAVFQAVQLPAGIAHLDASLTDMDRDTLALKHILSICHQ